MNLNLRKYNVPTAIGNTAKQRVFKFDKAAVSGLLQDSPSVSFLTKVIDDVLYIVTFPGTNRPSQSSPCHGYIADSSTNVIYGKNSNYNKANYIKDAYYDDNVEKASFEIKKIPSNSEEYKKLRKTYLAGIDFFRVETYNTDLSSKCLVNVSYFDGKVDDKTSTFTINETFNIKNVVLLNSSTLESIKNESVQTAIKGIFIFEKYKKILRLVNDQFRFFSSVIDKRKFHTAVYNNSGDLVYNLETENYIGNSTTGSAEVINFEVTEENIHKVIKKVTFIRDEKGLVTVKVTFAPVVIDEFENSLVIDLRVKKTNNSISLDNAFKLDDELGLNISSLIKTYLFNFLLTGKTVQTKEFFGL